MAPLCQQVASPEAEAASLCTPLAMLSTSVRTCGDFRSEEGDVDRWKLVTRARIFPTNILTLERNLQFQLTASIPPAMHPLTRAMLVVDIRRES